jgi:hypothetical protein
MERFPIELACYFEYRGVRPEEKRRLAFYCVSVGATSVNYLVRHHRIHCFAVDWPRMQKRRKANCDREKDYPKSGEVKLARSMSWHSHHSADEFPDVVLLRES